MPESTPGASVVAVKRVNELGFYQFDLNDVASTGFYQRAHDGRSGCQWFGAERVVPKVCPRQTHSNSLQPTPAKIAL